VTPPDATVPADVIDFREHEALAAEDEATRWAQVGDEDARDGFLQTAARAYVEAAKAWTIAAERWAASGRDAEMREAAGHGATCANAAAACLWATQADRF
jgi:hypothetical protein